ncbi:MucBP domain-containing protein [Demequina sp.]|uniref:MucBP domain-containing protein n=1 Tax=Demequina sp. TaxID=2050685 RepID=UPI003D14F6D6
MFTRITRPLAVVVATATLTSVGLAAASAEPGHPGNPGDPTVVFHEDFEKAPHSGDRTMLNDYDDGQYTADSYWLSNVMANGMVLSWNNTAKAKDGTGANNGTEDVAFATLRQLAEGIGKVNGSADAKNNEVISAYTQSTGAAVSGNRVMLQTKSESLKVKDAKGRFLAFSMSAAATNCKNASNPTREDPQYKLYLVQGGKETSLSTTPINPCTDSRASSVAVSKAGVRAATTVKAGVFASDNSFLYDGESFGFVLRNGTSAHMGDDGAFDDIAVIDVTPQLDKKFSVSKAEVGESVRLTLTVTNTSELAEKDGWSFTDALPAGMVVADKPNVEVGGTAKVNATAGSNEIVVTGGQLDKGEKSFTISVDVTVSAAGEYSNGAANIEARRGIDAPGTATVRFIEPENPVVTGDLVVRYVDEDGNPVADGDSDSGAVGDAYSTTAKTVDGYVLKETPANASGSFAEGTTTVTYVYAKVIPVPVTGDLTVRYIDENGNDIADGYTDSGNVGDAYSTAPKTVDGYILTAVPANAAGEYVEGTTEVTYVYKKVVPAPVHPVLVVRYVDERGVEVAAGYTDSDQNVGDAYTTAPKTVDGYVLKVVPANASGTLAEGTTTVTYVYAKVTPAHQYADLTVCFVDTKGKPLAPSTFRTGEMNENYVTTAAKIKGYKLVATPANANGSMLPGTEVVYVYSPEAPVTPTKGHTPTGTLSFTGSDSARLIAIAAALAMGGFALIGTARRRRED